MKKVLSSLLAFAMVLALFSGVVLFNTSAEGEDVWMSIPFINQYTSAEVARMAETNSSGHDSLHNDYWTATQNSSNYSVTKRADGKVEFSYTTASEVYYSYYWAIFSSATRANTQKVAPLNRKIDIFGDAELSNKKGIAIKFNGDDAFKQQFKSAYITLESSQAVVAFELKNPVQKGDYLYYDFSGAKPTSASTITSIADAYPGKIDALYVAVMFKNPSVPVKFWIDDFCVVGTTDTRELYSNMTRAKAGGIDITAAEAVYKNPDATQAEVDAAAKAIGNYVTRISLINQYTKAQAQNIGFNSDWASGAESKIDKTLNTITKDELGRTVINLTTPSGADSSNRQYIWFSTAKSNATPQYVRSLVNNINIFGDAEISNKTKLAIRLRGDDAFNSKLYRIAQVNLCSSITYPTNGSDKRNSMVVYTSTYTKVGEYYVFDLVSGYHKGGDDRSGCNTLGETYDGQVDSLIFKLTINNAPSTPMSFWIEDAFLIGAADTRELHKVIRDAKAANVDAALITVAETVYKDTATTQAQVDAQVAILKNAIDSDPFDKDYIYTQLPGIQDWTASTMAIYNDIGTNSAKDKTTGTPGSLVNDHTVGAAKQAVRIELGNNLPNSWSADFSTIANADTAAASQLGDVLGEYKKLGTLMQYDGIRIAVQNAYGNEPSFEMNPNKNQIVYLGFRGSGSKAWNNTSHAWASDTVYKNNVDDASLANTAVYKDGYYYFYFKDFKCGWNQYADFFNAYASGHKSAEYGNIVLYFYLSNFNSSYAYNGGALYLSDMQLFREHGADKTALGEAITMLTGLNSTAYAAELAAAQAVYDDYAALQSEVNAQTDIINDCIKAAIIGDYWEYNYTAESWAPLAQAAAALDVDAAATAKAALVPYVTVATTGNLMEGWTTDDVNAVVTANSNKLADYIKGGNADFTYNTTFAADNNLALTAGVAFDADKAMGWKNMDRSGTLAVGGANYGYPLLNVAGLSDSDGLRFKLNVEGGEIDHFVVGISNCAGHVYEQHAMNLKAENVDADGYINIPWSYFVTPAAWAKLFTQEGLDTAIVFLVEYYGATAGTKLTISDLHGYRARTEADDIADVTANLWQYNYTPESWSALQTAIAGGSLAAVQTAITELVPANVKTVTENFFKGWTTEDVNLVVTANSGKLCDSIGEGLNINNAWNAGDFSRNTTFAMENGAFVMTATADFTGKAMGWKNMDRSGSLNTDKKSDDAGRDYPFMAANVKGLSKAEGIRFKLEANKPVERILIGLSNCDDFVREMYAMQIKPEYVGDDGYINIPFSKFEAAWWSDAFTQDELEQVLVFIVEAYGAEEGTTITVSDFRGYKTIVAPTQADLDNLDAALAKLAAFDYENRYSELAAEAAAAKTSADQDDVLDAIAAVKAVTDKADAVDRSALKVNIDAVKAIDAILWATEIAAGVDAYYNLDAVATDIAAAAKVLQRIIDKPEAPVIAATAKTDTSITVTEIAGAKYKLNDGEWQDSNVFEGLLPNKAYAVSAYIAENDDHIASDVSVAIDVTTEKGSFGTATVTLSGTERYTEVLTATVADVPEYLGTYAIEWRNEAGETVGTGETYTIAAADIGSFVYAVLVSENAGDTVASDPTGTIGKGIIKGYTLPTASAIQYPQTVGDSVLSGADTGIVTGTWSWVTPDAQPLSSQTGSAFDVVFTPDANFIDLYEIIEARVVLTINPAPYEPASLEDNDTNTDLVVTGEFMLNTEMHVTYITYKDPAYLALLRASGKDNSGLSKLVLFKNFSFTVNGEEIDDVYDGDLTVTSFVGTSRAGQTVSAWFFIDGKPVNYEGTVDSEGILTVTGVKL